MNRKFFLPIVMLSILSILGNVQCLADVLSKEDAFLYYLKANGYSLRGTKWMDVYLESMLPDRLRQARQDEFAYRELVNSTTERLEARSNQLDFKKKYSVIVTTELGDYDFSSSTFPINKDMKFGFIYERAFHLPLERCTTLMHLTIEYRCRKMKPPSSYKDIKMRMAQSIDEST